MIVSAFGIEAGAIPPHQLNGNDDDRWNGR